MYPRYGGVGPMLGGPGFVERGRDHAGHPLGFLVLFLLLALVIALVVWIVLQIAQSRRTGAQPAAAGAPLDDALGAARRRYAEGQIDRNEFLRISEDLAGSPPPAPSQ
jgi:uncharacterized membrane protein